MTTAKKNDKDKNNTQVLARLAKQINSAHDACEKVLVKAQQTSLQHAVRAGKLLVEAKKLVGHGQWLDWLEKHFAGNPRTAQRYMTLATELEKRQREAKQQAANKTPEQQTTNEVDTTQWDDLSCRQAMRKLLEDKKESNVHHSSQSAEWLTPPSILKLVQKVFGGEIDLDPCSEAETTDNPNVPAKKHYTKQSDGLKQPWQGKVFLNPPYGQGVEAFINRLCHAVKKEQSVQEAIVLLPARTETDWIGKLAEYPRAFIRGRLRFSGHENSAPFPSVVIYVGKDSDSFVEVFDEIADIYQANIVTWRRARGYEKEFKSKAMTATTPEPKGTEHGRNQEASRNGQPAAAGTGDPPTQPTGGRT